MLNLFLFFKFLNFLIYRLFFYSFCENSGLLYDYCYGTTIAVKILLDEDIGQIALRVTRLCAAENREYL